MDNLLACFGYGWRFCRSTSGYCSVFLTIFYRFLTFLTIFQANKVFTILMTWLAWDSLLLYVHREPTGVSGRHKNVRDTLQYAALWNFTSSWNSLLYCVIELKIEFVCQKKWNWLSCSDGWIDVHLCWWIDWIRSCFTIRGAQ